MRSILAKSLLLIAALAAPLAPGFAEPRVKGPDKFWLPITDAERKLSAPLVEKDAGAEAIFWRVFVGDERFGQDLQRVLYHYVRLKIFTQEGKEKASTIDIEFGDQTYISDLVGRTIKPDGSILELTKDAIHDRDLVKAGGIKRKARSFAMPGVEPGAIVEYRWKESRTKGVSFYMRLQFQREFPLQRVTYFIKPLPRDVTSYMMGIRAFNCVLSPLEQEDGGYTSTFVQNVPAFREEPLMPGEPAVRPWALIYYHEDDKRDPEKYWPAVGKKSFRELKPMLKSNAELRQTTAPLVAGASTDEEKVLRILRYLRTNLRSLHDSRVSDVDRARVIKQMGKEGGRTVSEILKSGIADSDETNVVFAAMTAEAGLDARPAMVASRNDLLFNPKLAERHFLPNIDMAVKLGDRWKLYDVGTRLLPPQMLHWTEEGMSALVTDAKNPEFIVVPLSEPKQSLVARKAALALDAEGAIEGDAEESWTGHKAADLRADLVGESDARQEERIKEAVLKSFPHAELSGLKVADAENTEQPLVIRYHIKIPGYAQRTGKRLFFQPFFFQRGAAPVFSAAERRYDMHFKYGWEEKDEVTFKLPSGFELEKGESPGNIDLGGPGSYTVKLSLVNREELRVSRDFVFGLGGNLLYPKAVYPQVKRVFDEIHLRDDHMLALRQAPASGGL